MSRRGGNGHGRSGHGRSWSWLLLVAVLLLALNLRGPLTAVAPLAGLLGSELHADAGTVGLLTSLPVLCFGLATPLAAVVIARAGVHRAVLLCLAGILAGILLRPAAGAGLALVATVVIGIAITVGNVVVPVVIGRDFPTAAGLVTAAYTATLNVGSTLTSSLTAPAAQALGWRPALAGWAVLVVLAAAVWVRAVGWREPPDPAAPAGAAPPQVRAGAAPSPWRRPLAWGLTLAFAGQAFAYYGVTAWLPSLLADERGLSRAEAGASSSLFQVFAVVGAFAVPALLRWLQRPWVVLLIVCVAWTALPLGLLLAPTGWVVWCSLAGAAQGGGITILFVAVVRHARDGADNRRLSAFMQGGGYTIAAVGPLVVGAAHDATGSWSAPLLVILAAIAVMALAGVPAAGGRTTAGDAAGAPRPTPAPTGA